MCIPVQRVINSPQYAVACFNLLMEQLAAGHVASRYLGLVVPLTVPSSSPLARACSNTPRMLSSTCALLIVKSVMASSCLKRLLCYATTCHFYLLNMCRTALPIIRPCCSSSRAERCARTPTHPPRRPIHPAPPPPPARPPHPLQGPRTGSAPANPSPGPAATA